MARTLGTPAWPSAWPVVDGGQRPRPVGQWPDDEPAGLELPDPDVDPDPDEPAEEGLEVDGPLPDGLSPPEPLPDVLFPPELPPESAPDEPLPAGEAALVLSAEPSVEPSLDEPSLDEPSLDEPSPEDSLEPSVDVDELPRLAERLSFR